MTPSPVSLTPVFQSASLALSSQIGLSRLAARPLSTTLPLETHTSVLECKYTTIEAITHCSLVNSLQEATSNTWLIHAFPMLKTKPDRINPGQPMPPNTRPHYTLTTMNFISDTRINPVTAAANSSWNRNCCSRNSITHVTTIEVINFKGWYKDAYYATANCSLGETPIAIRIGRSL
ncbi:hypothetical protein BDR26DRAFT_855914, partial [Obelidium mucronatum]